MINSSLQEVSRDLSTLPPMYAATFDDATNETEYTVEPYEVFFKLSHVKAHKSPGPDGIPNWFLKEYAFAISEPICHIFNASISTGIVPRLWKTANVVPIPKSRLPTAIESDLRPRSLTPTLSKVLVICRSMDLV
jgi:hypothetical protein